MDWRVRYAGKLMSPGEAVRLVKSGDRVFAGMFTGTSPALCSALFDRRAELRGVTIYHYNTSSFAERAVVPAQTAIPIDSSLPLAEFALMGCAVMTGVGAVLNTAKVRPGETVAVVGCGGVGLNVIQGAAIANAGAIVAVDVVPAKLELARSLGATHTIDASAGGVVEAVHKLLGGGTDHAFEAIGRKETIELAIQLAGRGGQTILVGLAPPDAAVRIDTLTMIFEERAIRGSWYGGCRPLVDFPRLFDFYRQGKLRLDPLVSTCSLGEINEAFAAMETGAIARKVIVF